MKVIISERSKSDTFIALFQLLKNWSSHITMGFQNDGLHIQSMDKSHICLTKIFIQKDWFLEYNYQEDINVSVDTAHFYSIINYGSDHEQIHLDSNEEILFISFININKENTSKYDHFFEISLIDVEDDTINIPIVDYDVDFIIESKKLNEMLSELGTFGTNINVICTEETLEFNSNDDRSKLKININIDDLDEFSISEGVKLDVTYSLLHFHKMCISQKLSKKVQISLSEQYPMMINYDLGNESKASFYVAPKIV